MQQAIIRIIAVFLLLTQLWFQQFSALLLRRRHLSLTSCSRLWLGFIFSAVG
jgi:hypothetical protein